MSKTIRFGYSDTDTTTSELFEQLSISLDNNNKFLPHRHIASKPKLKRLLKLKTSSSVNNISAAFCTRCKKETLVFGTAGESNQHNVSEKEVEVRKDFIVKSYDKKVHFVGSHSDDNLGEKPEKADERKVEVSSAPTVEENEKHVQQEERINNDDSEFNSTLESESAATQVQFQSVFFARRPSIIGNNEFWLPTYPSSDGVCEETTLQPVSETLEEEGIAQEPEQREQYHEEDKVMDPGCDISERCKQSEAEGSDSLLSELSVFLNNIFKHSSTKQVRILQVATMLDDTLAILTEEHFFKCKSIEKSYEIIDAICLKDVQKIMVSESCTLLVLELCYASSLTEFKEFVPGYSEKTESLISLMVYALSRIKNFLLDVTRLPLLALPTCETMHNWFVMQNEEIIYTGIATAENISHPDYEDLCDESFMMKIAGTNQFHPVVLLLRSGYFTSKCNGGCASKGCKYSITLELKKEKVSVMRREDNPWPNCVRLITECVDITFAGSRKASADDLMEKLYSCIQPVANLCCMTFKIFVIVTENTMKMFKMTTEKAPVFGSPLLNLEIFDKEPGGISCIIDSQGVEVADIENLQIQNSWHLTFLNENEKLRFLAATTVD